MCGPYIWDGTERPVRDSFRYIATTVDGRDDEIARFDTVPFADDARRGCRREALRGVRALAPCAIISI